MKKILALILLSLSGLAAAADSQDREFNKVFDANKGKLYAAYSRALRDNPRLAGKTVFEIDIAKTGDVTACRVQYSNMGAPDLQKNFCDRLSQMKFRPRDAAMTATKTVEFFPSI